MAEKVSKLTTMLPPGGREPRAIKSSLSNPVVGQNIALDVVPAYRASIST